MTAARRAVSLCPEHEPFVERLRLLLLIRALETAAQGVLREGNLAEVCLSVRQVADDSAEPKWAWMGQIAHPATGFLDFANETRFQLAKLSAANPSRTKAGHFNDRLNDVLEGNLRALDAQGKPSPAGKLTEVEVILPPWPSVLTPSTFETFEPGESSARNLHIEDGIDESRTYAFGRVDMTRSAPAQRDQGNGIVLQSLEDSQYLRHSWHRLSRVEEAEFQKRLLELIQVHQPAVDRLGSALSVVAMLTSTSLSSIESMPIGTGLGDDWALGLVEGTLRRRPSRFPGRWSASAAKAIPWVRPLATEWRIDLSSEVVDALRVGVGPRRKPRLMAIGDLWKSLSPSEPLHIWFGRRFADIESLERLTSPVVSTLVGQQVFEHVGDHAQARLASASIRSGLPSPCAYGAYAAVELQHSLVSAINPGLGSLVEPRGDSGLNASGSELDVDLSRLAEAIGAMVERLDQVARQPKRWVDHHNQLSALCVIALLASTGARPVNSPFESFDWIDLKRRIVYVEDKHSGPTRGSRLCVLSDLAYELLTNHYLPHLAGLARALSGSLPSMATELEKILSGDSECRLPLFFFLRAEPTFDWIEVTESQLTSVCRQPWPLPWNVFRHLHATQLRRWGLNAEIRDALLSHGDKGAESHGIFSWRIPRDDLEFARPLVNRLVKELGLRLPAAQPVEPRIDGPIEAAGLDFGASSPFGRTARALRRDRTHQAARRTALLDIEKLINGKPASSLSEGKWDEIARAMLFRPDGLPHPMASVRYETFEDHLSALWRAGIQPKLPSVRRIPMREGASIFSEESIKAPDSLADVRRRFDELLVQAEVRSPRRPVMAGCLAVLELALYCRVSHFAVLAAVVCNGASIKIVRFDSRYWLEWAYRGDWKDGRPAYRVPITERAAGWIGIAQGAKKELADVPETPEALRALVGTNAFAPWVKDVAILVDQANNFELPGAMAAALSGELETAALPHSDWIRNTFSAAPTVRVEDSDGQRLPTDGDDNYFRNHQRSPTLSTADPVARCRTLFAEIFQILSADKAIGAGPQLKEDREATVSPKQRAAEIDRAVQASDFGHGDAPFVLAHYAAHLLKRPKQTGPGGTLKASTARRYWEALQPGFLDFAFDVNLSELEEDELTALYEKIVGAAKPTSDDSTSPVSPGHASRRRLKEDSDAAERTLNELVRFHEFASPLYGLEDPDWAEISPGKRAGQGRPGIVLEAEYEAALGAMARAGQIHLLDDDSLAAAFVLFVCARFGLRGGEAVGLQRRDWLDIRGAIVVLVRTNHLRTLKNIRSKRQVPLIGSLNALERSLADETLRRWENREGIDRKSPLLPGVDARGFKLQKRWIASRLLPLIKSVTRNQASVTHHLRHGFACRLLALLSGRQLGTGVRHTTAEVDDARQLLMSSRDVGRRTLWAVARALGHASPTSSCKAYLHTMDTWLPQPLHRVSAINLGGALHVLDLDAVPRDPNYLAGEFNVSTRPIAPESLWVQSLRFLRLRALGNADAQWFSKLDTEHVESLDDALLAAASRLQIMSSDKRNVRGMLAGVKAKRWNILVDLACAAPKDSDLRPELDWTGTIGANRQIVLFLPEHFAWAGKFVKALGMTPGDCRLVRDHKTNLTLDEGIESSGLAAYVTLSSEYARSFQIDRAVQGPIENFHTYRVALVPAGARVFRDGVELLIMWLTWLWCSRTADEEFTRTARRAQVPRLNA